MKLKRLLEGIGELTDRIRHDRALLRYYRSEAGKIPGPVYGERPHTQPSGRAPFEKWVNKALDKENEIAAEEKELEDMKVRAATAIEGFEDRDMGMAVIYRFLSLMTYDEIMSAMHLSRSSVYRLLDDAKPVIECTDA